MIISISREYGSRGHEIAKILAERLGISYYDRNMLDEIAKEKGVNVENLSKYDERPRKLFFSRTVRGFSNSPEEAVAEFQFDYLKKKAESGESFVIVGRCSNYVLSEYSELLSFFVLGDEEEKCEYVQKTRDVNKDEALGIMNRHDKSRKAYHNYYCPIKWGDSRGYDMTINSSRLGVEKTTDIIERFIKLKFDK